MSKFNPEAFMATEIEGESETDYTPIPEGEYSAFVKGIKADVTPKGQPLLELTWVVDDQGVRDELGMDEPTVRHTVWLDVNESGVLDFGTNKNVQLGRLREAFGQNTAAPWKPQDMLGKVGTVNLKHRITDTGAVYAEVKGIRA